MVNHPKNYHHRLFVIDSLNRSNLISKSMYVNSSFDTVGCILSSWKKAAAILCKCSFANYAIAVESILYSIDRKYPIQEYCGSLQVEFSHCWSHVRLYSEEIPNYTTTLHLVSESSRPIVQVKDRQSDQTIATTEMNPGQDKEHVVFLSGFCIFLTVSVIVLRHWYKMKKKDHAKLQVEKADFEQRVNREIKLKTEENLRLRHQNEDLEDQINLQFHLLKEELIRLQIEYEKIQKEALVEALRMERKNRLLDLLREKLRNFEDMERVGTLEKMIRDEMRLDEVVGQSVREFQDINPDLFLRLKEISENKLSALELKYCAYMYLNLTTKEIAAAFHIEPSSVRVTKYRIKQKLQLTRENDLDSFVQQLV